MSHKSSLLPFRGLAAAGAVVLLGGCISFGGEPPDLLLTLTPQSGLSAGVGPSGMPASALLVEEPDAPQRLAVNRIPVQVDDTGVAYLTGAEWVERPSRLFRRLLAETIRSKNGRLVMERDDPSVVSSEVLRGTLREFGYDARSQSVTVTFDAIRKRADNSLETRRFTSSVPGVLPEAAPVGQALNTAANAVVSDVANWVG